MTSFHSLQRRDFLRGGLALVGLGLLSGCAALPIGPQRQAPVPRVGYLGSGAQERAEEALAESLEILRETRAILTELLTSRPEGRLELWLLRGSVLAAVEQVLVQLDLERRARLRSAWQRPAPIAAVAPLVRDALPRARARRTGTWSGAPDSLSPTSSHHHPR